MDRQVDRIANAKTWTAGVALAAISVFAISSRSTALVSLMFVVGAGAALAWRSVVLLAILAAGALVAELSGGLLPLVARDAIGMRDLASAAALLVWIAAAYRFVELCDADEHGNVFRTLLSFVWELVMGRQMPDVDESASSRAAFSAKNLRPLRGLATRLPLAILFSWLVLRLLPVTEMFPNPPHLLPSAYRAVLVFWGFVIAVLTTTALFSVWRWRRLLPRQAGLYLHRVVSEELAGERSLLRRRKHRLERKP